MRRLYTRIFLHFLGVLVVVGFALSLVFATGWRTAFIRPFTLRLVNHLAMQISQLPDASSRRRMVQRLSGDLDLDLTLRRLDGTVETSTGEELPPIAAREFDEVRKGPTVVHRGRRWMVVAPVRDRSNGELIGIYPAELSHASLRPDDADASGWDGAARPTRGRDGHLAVGAPHLSSGGGPDRGEPATRCWRAQLSHPAPCLRPLPPTSS